MTQLRRPNAHNVFPAIPPVEAKQGEQTGLACWMQRVLDQIDRVGTNLEADPVHDLRVALRRCRSLADGMRLIDPSPAWKHMKREGTKLFRALGQLRDSQVMTEWIEKLAAPDDLVGKALAANTAACEGELKRAALADLQEFNRKRWIGWSDLLPKREIKLRLGNDVFRHMALERWTEARSLQEQALRNRSRVSYHRLRIGLKRLRYTIENFLPELHQAWIRDLKELQDLLGEVHDLDVVWATANHIRAFPDKDVRSRWGSIISSERTKRLEKYRAKMVGRDSLWYVWRKELPHGSEIEGAAMARLKIWASLLDPEFPHAQRVARVALQIYDGLEKNGLMPRGRDQDLRAILHVAGLLHGVGRSKRTRQYHKSSARMLRKLRPPLGWNAKDLHFAGLISRYHRGPLPSLEQWEYRKLGAGQRKKAELLAGILRLAEALDAERNGTVTRIRVENDNGYLSVVANGYVSNSPGAERVARARHLLEIVYGQPVIVRGEPVKMKPAP